MKILHTLAQLPSQTGSGVYYSSMVEGFKKYNYQQKALFACQNEYSWDVLDIKDQYPVGFKSKDILFPIVGMSDVMPYESIKYSSMTDEMVGIWIDAFRNKLLEIKKDFKPDIIFAHHLWILTSLVREVFPQSKVIGICHNTDLRQSKMNPRLKKRYASKIDSLNHVFSISDEQKEEIVEIYNIGKEKIITVGGGFNQDIFYFPDKKSSSDKIKLVFAGKIDPSKGIYELIEVYKSLKLDDITLDIIGNPDKDNKRIIEDLIKDDKSIKLLGSMKQGELGDELRKKDIFIMPSFYEGLALMAIESLACGLYVVTTEIEVLKSFLGKEIEKSGVIKYVALPRIYDTDKPVEEDLPVFRENLKENILTQIKKIRENNKYPSQIEENIKCFSWEGLVKDMNDIINREN